jgi:hypothetical protein
LQQNSQQPQTSRNPFGNQTSVNPTSGYPTQQQFGQSNLNDMQGGQRFQQGAQGQQQQLHFQTSQNKSPFQSSQPQSSAGAIKQIDTSTLIAGILYVYVCISVCLYTVCMYT